MNFSKLYGIAFFTLIPLAIVHGIKLSSAGGRCFVWAREGSPIIIKSEQSADSLLPRNIKLMSRTCETKYFKVLGVEIPTSDRIMTYEEYEQFSSDGFKEVKEFFPVW
ncbi:MAG: hypothetical protein CMN92_05360 [Synechococcus sp. CPC100]|nr:hypothetical protein [Synechococcus sp. CPC100]|tara:strand:+ start:8679 stop:9002 length:324 start_codon:yes stop_codon:yes gene_type:complete